MKLELRATEGLIDWLMDCKSQPPQISTWADYSRLINVRYIHSEEAWACDKVSLTDDTTWEW